MMNVTRTVSARWTQPQTVAAFAQGEPNAVLMAYAATLRARRPHGQPCGPSTGGHGQPFGPSATGLTVLDIGCGAGRNALPLAALGDQVVGTDLSEPMIVAACARAAAEETGVEGGSAALGARLTFLVEPMAPLPFEDASFDLIIAHGVWNLATSDAELRAAVAEAARVAKPGAGLFLFTFSRNTVPEYARPVAGESFIFTELAGEPQCFLTHPQVVAELAAAGFDRDSAEPMTEYNRPGPGQAARGPVIWEGTFTRRSA